MRRIYKLVEVDFESLQKGDLFTFDDGPLGPGKLDYTYIALENPSKREDGLPHILCDYVTGKELATKHKPLDFPDKAAIGRYAESEKNNNGATFTVFAVPREITEQDISYDVSRAGWRVVYEADDKNNG